MLLDLPDSPAQGRMLGLNLVRLRGEPQLIRAARLVLPAALYKQSHCCGGSCWRAQQTHARLTEGQGPTQGARTRAS